MLSIRNLRAGVEGKRDILKRINLEVRAGEVHAVMGPNGSGKSTLAQVLAGHPGYIVTAGEVTYLGQDLLALPAEERARAGLFLAFQYPVEIPGVSNAYFLKAAVNERRSRQGQEELDAMEFLQLLEEKLKVVEMDRSFVNRPVNEGFSGGEKKRNEILQMAVLEPKLAILDETDSGLDIDALKTVAQGVNRLRRPDNAIILVTHYQRILQYVEPDHVHVLFDGRIVKSGGKELALELERKGYDWIREEVAAGDSGGTRGAMTTSIATAKDRYLAEFEALERQGAFRSPSWLAPLRRRAIDRFAERGFPTTRDEDWRYTNLGAARGDAVPTLSPTASPAGVPARRVERPRRWPDRGRAWSSSTAATRPSSRRRARSRAAAGPASLAEAMITDADMVERHLGRHAAGTETSSPRSTRPSSRTAPSSACRPRRAATTPHRAPVPGHDAGRRGPAAHPDRRGPPQPAHRGRALRGPHRRGVLHQRRHRDRRRPRRGRGPLRAPGAGRGGLPRGDGSRRARARQRVRHVRGDLRRPARADHADAASSPARARAAPSTGST